MHIIVIGNQFALTTPSDFFIYCQGQNTGINAPSVCPSSIRPKKQLRPLKHQKQNIQFKKCKFEREKKEREREKYWSVGREGAGLRKGIQQFTVKRL